jgi:hypothetical protein
LPPPAQADPVCLHPTADEARYVELPPRLPVREVKIVSQVNLHADDPKASIADARRRAATRVV